MSLSFLRLLLSMPNFAGTQKMSNLKSLFSILIASVNVVVLYFQDKRKANLLVSRFWV